MTLAFACSACTPNYIGDWVWDNYRDVQPQTIQSQGTTWGILDKPEEGRMLVVPGRTGSIEQYEAAAEDYFEQVGRVCTIRSGGLKRDHDNVELFYLCKK